MHHHHCTFHGLEEWSCHMFEKLGWMTLAARDGHKESIQCYLSSLKYLCEKIGEKKKETVDIDRRKDLDEMMANVKYLMACSKKLLKK
jgi:hypothetical protein